MPNSTNEILMPTRAEWDEEARPEQPRRHRSSGSHRSSRRRKAERRKRRVRLAVRIVLGIVSLGLAAAGSAAYFAKSAEKDLEGARVAMLRAKDDVQALRGEEARREIQTAQGLVRHARKNLSAFPVKVFEQVPLLGNSLKAGARIGAAADDVLAAAANVLDAVGPASLQNLKLEGGRLPDVQWSALAAAARSGIANLQNAASEIQGVPTTAVPGKVHRLRTSFAQEIGRAQSMFARLGTVADIAGHLAKGHHTVLLVLQNSSELRATGGYPDQMIPVDLDNGAFEIRQAHFDTGFKGTEWEQFRALLTKPDFPTAAGELSNFVEQAWGIRSEMVMSLDTVGLSSLFDVTGPISTDGVTVSKSSFVNFSTVEIYRKFETETTRHPFEYRFIGELVSRLLSGKVGFSKLANALAPMTTSKHVMLFARDQGLEKQLKELNVAGALDVGAGEVAFGVFGNALNHEWSKLGPFQKRQLTFTGSIDDETLDGTLDVAIKNDAPAGLPPYMFGPLNDDTLRTLVSVPGITAQASEVDVRRGATGETKFHSKFTLHGRRLVLHMFAQPVVNPDRVTIRISLPRGSSATNVSGFQVFGGNELVFSGILNGDLTLSAEY